MILIEQEVTAEKFWMLQLKSQVREKLGISLEP